MITDYAKNIYRIEERMRDSEARAAEASKQVSYGREGKKKNISF